MNLFRIMSNKAIFIELFVSICRITISIGSTMRYIEHIFPLEFISLLFSMFFFLSASNIPSIIFIFISMLLLTFWPFLHQIQFQILYDITRREVLQFSSWLACISELVLISPF